MIKALIEPLAVHRLSEENPHQAKSADEALYLGQLSAANLGRSSDKISRPIELTFYIE